MGWNNLKLTNGGSILENIDYNSLFYFVHSFYVECDNESDIVAKTNYDLDFVSVFRKMNIYGCQFHPEKSHDSGLQVLKNFVTLNFI